MPTPKRVLCAEPAADVCDLIGLLLTRQGYEADSASTVSEALSKAEARRYDLFIVSDGYRDGTGAELTRRLRASQPLAPVIVFSAHTHERDRQEAADAGAAAFLDKPEGIGRLARTAERLMR